MNYDFFTLQHSIFNTFLKAKNTKVHQINFFILTRTRSSNNLHKTIYNGTNYAYDAFLYTMEQITGTKYRRNIETFTKLIMFTESGTNCKWVHICDH